MTDVSITAVSLRDDADTAGAARDILARAAEHDGVEAFSEAFVRGLDGDEHTHIAALIDGSPAGLAALSPDGSAELVVDPPRRGAGIGAALAREVLGRREDAGLWAHGNLPPAQALAVSLGLNVVRELLVMDIAGEKLEAIAQGTDELLGESASRVGGSHIEDVSYAEAVERWGREDVDKQWLCVNNDAFSWHPEQGGWDLHRLHEGVDTDWFDPNGVRFLWDVSGEPELAGFHWTKRHSRTLGEVYVVGLASNYRGKGLGEALMRAGLEHLVGGGAERVILYVESDNTPAVKRYEDMGFTVAERHVVYSPQRSL
nr:Mycothiol acetyltransferase [Streptococcus thermophilus]